MAFDAHARDPGIAVIVNSLSFPSLKTSLCEGWLSREVCSKRELLSLIGVLHHASTVIRPGRSFVRRLIDLLTSVRLLDRPLRLNCSASEDIAWWHAMAADWNGVGWFDALGLRSPSVFLQSDASGSWGCGVRWGDRWFQWQWCERWEPRPIAPKEALPVVLAAAVWGPQWRGLAVLVESDNSTVVAAVKSGSSKDSQVMRLTRVLQFLAAKNGFVISARHVPGKANSVADTLSREKPSDEFLSSVQLRLEPDRLPPELVAWIDAPQWTSVAWRKLQQSYWTAV